jgi:hypothetical protein
MIKTPDPIKKTSIYIGLVAAALATVLFWLFRFAMNRPQVPNDVAGDMYRLYFPNLIYAVDQIKQGTLPLWNPYEFLGMPMIATLEFGPWYPLTWLYLLGPVQEIHLISALIHMLILGTGMYWLLVKRLNIHPLAGIVAAFVLILAAWSQTRSLMFMDAFRSFAWLPWILIATDALIEKATYKRAILLGTCIALQFLAGEIEIAIRTGQVLLLFIPFRWFEYYRDEEKTTPNLKSLYGIIGAGIFAIGITAVQWIPTLEASRQSLRSTGGLTYDQVMMAGIEESGQLIQHLISGSNTDNMFYIGFPILCLAAYGLFNVRSGRAYFAILAFLAFELIRGKGSLIATAYYNLPLGDWFRWPERFQPFLLFALAGMAGLGVHQIYSDLTSKEKSNWVKLRLILFPLIFIGAAQLWDRTAPSPEYITGLIFTIMTLGYAIAAFFILPKIPAKAYIYIIAPLFIAAFHHTYNYKPLNGYIPPKELDLHGIPDEMLAHIQENIQPGERIYVDYALEDGRRVPKIGPLLNFPAINGFSPFMPATFWRDIEDAQTDRLKPKPDQKIIGVPVGLWGGLDSKNDAIGVLKKFGVAFVVLGPGNEFDLGLHTNGLRKIMEENDLTLWKVPNLSPRAWTSGDPMPRDPAEIVPATISTYDSQSIVIEIPKHSNNFLYIVDQYYPGWTAVDQTGTEKEIEPASYLRAIKLDGTETSITLRYKPFSFRLGAIVTIASFFLTLMFALVLRKKLS